MKLQYRHATVAGLVLLVLLPACRAPETSDAASHAPEATAIAHVHSVEDALASFRLPEGYSVELVAAEPMIEDPVAIDFDADGRMYVVEMRGYMPNLAGEGEDARNGRIVVLEDSDDDGLMDRRSVFMDSLVLPRAVKVLDHGVLVAATPNLWLARDTDGDLRADSLELLLDNYGSPASNPEHNANGLLWGIDNWIHNANFPGMFRFRDGELELRATPSQGQWGVSMDDYGRLYRNSNEDPLRADLIPAMYATRNPNQASMRGVYERLTPNLPVWPARPTPAVNRGYRERTLREDSTLAHFTAAGSPTAYVGDRLPTELRNDVFITESAGNLVARFEVDEGARAMPTARRAVEGTDFMTSTDQRFRPVYLATAPDGTLYVVDMYRGIIQHRAYITGYLEQQIHAREMEMPVGLGRIYRIVHETTERGERPRLSGKTPAQLLEYLSHPNGWWRITAQRLIVERRDRSVAPALRELARGAEDDRTRLHALWTLDGIGEADPATVGVALGDPSEQVRAAAVRIAEPQVRQSASPLRGAVLRLVDDPSPLVRRQLAASLGDLPPGDRGPALERMAAAHGNDPIIADAIVSGVAGGELAFLERIVPPRATGTPSATVRSLVATLARAGDGSGIQRVLQWAADETRPYEQRVALLEGLAPADSWGRRGGSRVELPSEPRELLALTRSSDGGLSTLAAAVAERVSWPGKPTPEAPPARSLTREEQRLMAIGEQQYAAVCSTCHQASGEGLEGVARGLVGSEWVLGRASRVIRILLHGKEGEMLMPPLGSNMTDEEVAAVLTYVRRSWGNDANPISVEEVTEERGEAGPRRQPWTEEELARIR